MSASRAFVIEVMLMDDRWHGHSEWPPSPFRLFQALVTAAARGARLAEEDRQALTWLEELAPPLIAAPRCLGVGQRVVTYVPNNDLDAVGGDPDRVEEIRAAKHIQPRLLLGRPRFLYVWRFESEEGVHLPTQRLTRIVRRLYQLGRGVDMAWARAHVLPAEEAGKMLEAHDGTLHEPCGRHGRANRLGTPTKGSLASLERRFAAFRERLKVVRQGRRMQQRFHQPPKPVVAMVGYRCAPRRLLFEIREGARPEAFAPVMQRHVASFVKKVRDMLALRLKEAGYEQDLVERLVVGQGASEQDKRRRLRLVALPSIGMPHAGGAVRRLLVEVPQDCSIAVEDVEWALRIPCFDPDTGELTGQLLVPAADTGMMQHYGIPADGEHENERLRHLLWRTVTPAALPILRQGRTGHARAETEAEAVAAVRAALRHAGVKTRAVRIRVQREPFDRNSHMASHYEPDRFDPRQLWHVEILFEAPLEGPLVIGDGRFLGLGLMAPVAGRRWRQAVEHGSGAFVFALPGEGLPAAMGAVLLRTARAALMAIDADLHLPRRQPCGLFSGHPADDSAPLRQGHHAHVFLAAPPDRNGRITRLYVIPPWLADRSDKAKVLKDEQEKHFQRVCQRLKVLYGPGLERLPLSPVSFNGQEPLLGEGMSWRSVTPYRPTRHLKKAERGELERFIADDLRRECARRNLPMPRDIAVEAVERGPNGGLKAWVRMDFATAVSGPFLLGRQSHRGEGVFVRERQ